ncbi:MAG: hypothetical protein MI861_16430 [Pirellulales bacterium]|nr:hypothetical protein [Pirellulales bacterium]
MRCTAEYIARRSNREDEVTGHFWEGRYRAQVLLDEACVLACATYVDLNPVRAAMAETPESSQFTGAKDRLDDLSEHSCDIRHTHHWERNKHRKRSGWLSPIEIGEGSDSLGVDAEPTNRRASRKGFLWLSLADYLELLDWTGRQLRRDKRGAIPQHLQPILNRVGLNASRWCELIYSYGRIFRRAAGTATHLGEEAARRGQRWLQASGNPLAA